MCMSLVRAAEFVTTHGDAPPPEPLDMHCCDACGCSWCSACIEKIDARPTSARECTMCNRGRVIPVPRMWVAAVISPDERLPRCGCIRGMPVSAEVTRDHELHCESFLLLVLREIGAVQAGASYTDPHTIHALIALALEHPLP
jgi:hypothetical protein